MGNNVKGFPQTGGTLSVLHPHMTAATVDMLAENMVLAPLFQVQLNSNASQTLKMTSHSRSITTCLCFLSCVLIKKNLRLMHMAIFGTGIRMFLFFFYLQLPPSVSWVHFGVN